MWNRICAGRWNLILKRHNLLCAYYCFFFSFHFVFTGSGHRKRWVSCRNAVWIRKSVKYSDFISFTLLEVYANQSLWLSHGDRQCFRVSEFDEMRCIWKWRDHLKLILFAFFFRWFVSRHGGQCTGNISKGVVQRTQCATDYDVNGEQTTENGQRYHKHKV